MKEIKNEDLEKMTEYDLYNLQSRVKHQILLKSREKVKAIQEENKKYVGRCYYSDNSKIRIRRYYKVVSEIATSKGSVSVIRFSEKPDYTFKPLTHLINEWPEDMVCGSFEFEYDPIDLDEIPIKRIEDLTEIEPEMFDAAMKNYVNRLLSTNFTCDRKEYH